MTPCPTCLSSAAKMMAADANFAAVAKRYPDLRMGLCADCRSKCDAKVYGEDTPARPDGYMPELASTALIPANHAIIPFHPVLSHVATPVSPQPGQEPHHATFRATFLEETDRYMRVTVEAAIAYTIMAVAGALFIYHLGTQKK